MKTTSQSAEANQHLSRYIEAVERGEEVIITRRGKPVAKIVRVSSGLRLTGAAKTRANACWRE
ncbi:MAG: type II toxin-antitoxin system prevent-host-death family antitoxin [Sterolibacteriaceae bacterium]|uniref:Antitoxin n=1 Tax=Candidatus Methylophosphatis roskildensis TaxID=2899263 RepID=A0A9D7HM44_9PROT|nr:type II toxin-antitoxin system prevent-host-death family antitoxin [Candidatus Methylophosphatis roskildensis]